MILDELSKEELAIVKNLVRLGFGPEILEMANKFKAAECTGDTADERERLRLVHFLYEQHIKSIAEDDAGDAGMEIPPDFKDGFVRLVMEIYDEIFMENGLPEYSEYKNG